MWVFSSKDNITLSILLKPQNLENISNISLVAGASVYNTLKEYVNCSIKWPNDILIKDKKICGILLESISSSRIDALVIGIGLNVNQVEFDEEIKNKATSLKKELNMDFNKDEIIKKFINNFDYLYNDFINRGKIDLEIVRINFYLRNKKAFINNEEVKIIDVEEDGRLKVLKGNVVAFLNSGEVSLEKIYNN